MSDERWQQVKDIFHSALEQAPERRAAFLAEACAGHDSLRTEVESLISSHEQPVHFIDAPAFQAAAEMLADGQEFKPGETLSHYEIHSVLGEGGMGRVYLAEDTKLKRKVALKVLPALSSGDEEARKRLLREAQAAAALDHPNICAIYEVEEASDPCYIAMQYVEGETLEARMDKGRLSLDDSLNIATQIADALSEAHAHGIIHRDVKPANVMLTARGQVKVLDFGLAKTASPVLSGADKPGTNSLLTAPGVVLGTVPYMSPEQLRGKPVDARADIFSFGAVLYEMLSGRRAFARESGAETIGAILHERPPELASVDREIPQALNEVVAKCLAKDADERYQTMQQVARDLNAARDGELTAGLPTSHTGKGEVDGTNSRGAVSTDARIARTDIGHLVRGGTLSRWGVTVAAGAVILAAALGYYLYSAKGGEAIDSIAVLPFVNVNNDPNAEYLSDGISDSIINSLSQSPGIKRVISLNSALRFKGQQVDPQAVGREFNVQAVLMGRLTHQGDELGVSVELVDVRDHRRLWGEQYNRKLSDILVVQREIAQQVSSGLRLRLSGKDKNQIGKQYTENPNAEIAYLKGRYFHDKRTARDTEKSIEHLESAISLDPNYALAYATLANAHLSLSMLGSRIGMEEVLPMAKKAVEKALAIDDTLAEAHAARGSIRFYEWDWSGAEIEFKRAFELNPNYKSIHVDYEQYLLNMKRVDEAVAESKRVLELDPVSAYHNRNLAMVLYFARRYDEAIEQCQKTLELNPNMGVAYNWLWRAYEKKGLYDQAVEAYLKTGQISLEVVEPLRAAYATSGWNGFWRKALDLNMERAKRGINFNALAENYARLGEKDQALFWLEKAIEKRQASITVHNRNPFWDDFRSDPRFAALIRRMGLEP
jgi:serine/threonine-protein kinase